MGDYSPGWDLGTGSGGSGSSTLGGSSALAAALASARGESGGGSGAGLGSPGFDFSTPSLGSASRGLGGALAPPTLSLSSLVSPRTPTQSAQDAPEVARRAAEWERQIESLDQKEMEIHQTQLRLIREQTTTFRGDLLALRQEVMELKRVLEAGDQKHISVQQRLVFLENAVGESAEKHARELDALKGSHSKLFNDVAGRDQHHATVAERLNYIERSMGDSADRHAQELAVAHAKLDAFHSRISSCEALGGHIDSMKKAHSSLAKENADLATMRQRVEYLEQRVGESVDKHARALEDIKSNHTKLASDAKMRDRMHTDVTDRLHQVLKEKEHLTAKHASVEERLNFLEQLIGDSVDKHGKELAAARAAHSKLANDHKTREAQQVSLDERLNYVEKVLGDSAQRHADELSLTHGKLDQLHGKFLEEKKAREAHVTASKEHISAERERRESIHASMEERMKYLEGAIGDSFEKHAKELDKLKESHSKHLGDTKAQSVRHGSMEERLEFIENFFRSFPPKGPSARA